MYGFFLVLQLRAAFPGGAYRTVKAPLAIRNEKQPYSKIDF